MATVQRTAFCPHCREQRLFTKPRINHVLHLILSVLTLGIWALVVWIPLGILSSVRKPRCSRCGMTTAEAKADMAAAERIAHERRRQPQLDERTEQDLLEQARQAEA